MNTAKFEAAPRRKPMSRRFKIRPRTVAIHAVAWAIGLAWLIPFIGVAVVAVRPLSQTGRGWWNLSPFSLTFNNFVAAWNNENCPLSLGLRDSFLVALPATIIPMLIGALAGYGFARFHTRTRDYVFLAIVLFMAVPQMMVAVPIYNLMIRLGLAKSLLSLVLLHSAWGLPWIILFMRNFFRTLPAEVEEAARVDGASDFKIFYKIVLPMSLPAMAAIVVFQFMWVWNDFFFAQVLIQDPNLYLSTQCMPRLVGQFTLRPYDLLSAAAILTMSVPVVLYVVLQRFYIRGLIGWTIKG
jgi:multiple sugar transport system permease protein